MFYAVLDVPKGILEAPYGILDVLDDVIEDVLNVPFNYEIVPDSFTFRI